MSPHAPQTVRIRSRIAAAPSRAAMGARVVAAALAIFALPAAAALYKWTDANGRVIYSDQPPPGNVKVDTINAPPPPANPNAAKDLAAKEADLAQKRMLRGEDDAKAAKARVETAQKREQCAKMRGQLMVLAPDQNQQLLIFRSNEKGEPVYMDDAARRKEREQLEAWIKENCSA